MTSRVRVRARFRGREITILPAFSRVLFSPRIPLIRRPPHNAVEAAEVVDAAAVEAVAEAAVVEVAGAAAREEVRPVVVAVEVAAHPAVVVSHPRGPIPT